MFKLKTLLASIILALLLVLSGVAGVMAGPGADEIDLKGLTLSEIEALFPMSAEAEAAIVHVVPQVPVVIDGVLYKAEDITLFNGQRLRFIVDTDGVLNAFTNIKGLEQFVMEEFGQLEVEDAAVMNLRSSSYARFWEHDQYLGSAIFAGPGVGISDLGWMNDKISSVKVDLGIYAGVLFEHVNYYGSYLVIPEGASYPSLRPYGWNDRASSLIVLE